MTYTEKGDKQDTHTHLSRELTLYEVVAIGVGSVIGSGIFILFTSILHLGGKSTFLALLLAAIPNVLTALAYAELGALYQRNDMEYTSVKDAYASDTFAMFTTYILIFFMIFNSATVLLFIGTLVKHIVKDPFYLTLGLLFVLSIVNYIGIHASTTITNAIGIIEISLLTIIGLFAIQQWSPSLCVHLPSSMTQKSGFLMASFLSLFLYSGYDSIVKLSEETVNPGVNIPRGIMISVLLVTALYGIMALTATSVFQDVRTIHSPIRDMYERVVHTKSGVVVTIIGILIVVNAAFIGIISMSRFLYGLSKENKLPSFLQAINQRFKTPHNAVIAVFISMAFALLIYHPERTASIANIFFLVFMMILMVAVIILRIRNPDAQRPFVIPGNIYNIPILMVGGIISCAAYLIYGIFNFNMI